MEAVGSSLCAPAAHPGPTRGGKTGWAVGGEGKGRFVGGRAGSEEQAAEDGSWNEWCIPDPILDSLKKSTSPHSSPCNAGNIACLGLRRPVDNQAAYQEVCKNNFHLLLPGCLIISLPSIARRVHHIHCMAGIWWVSSWF